MKKSTYIISGIALVLSATYSCNTVNNVLGKNKGITAGAVTKQESKLPTATLDQTAKIAEHVLYGEWTVADVAGQGVVGDDRPYVVFDTTAVNPYILKYYAYDGCNILNGQVAVTPGGEMAKAGEGLSTMKFCPDAMYQTGITMALESVKTYKIEKIGRDYLLYMYDGSNTNTMILRKSDESFINGAWAVASLGNRNIDLEAGMQLVIDIPELRVHGNTGCNILNGSIFIDPDKQNSLQFKNLGVTRMACPDGATEQAFLVALEEVETAVQGSDPSIALLKNDSGKTVIKLRRINIKQ